MSRINDALRDILSLDALAARPSALSRIDARAKILATLGFILVVVSFDRYAIAPLLPFAAFPVLLAAAGDIPLRFIARKLLLAAPFAVMIGLFNPLLDRAPLLMLSGHAVSGGWVSFASIMLRFCLTVSAALVLVAATGFIQICSGLRQLGAPSAFATQLQFLHRYAQVLAGEAARMSLARELRSAPGQRLGLAVYGSLLGHLLLRALERSQRIHLAMLSRGLDSSLRTTHQPRWRKSDALFLAACLTGFGLARRFDLAQLLGALLLGRIA